jgi:hypothetical protein
LFYCHAWRPGARAKHAPTLLTTANHARERGRRMPPAVVVPPLPQPSDI